MKVMDPTTAVRTDTLSAIATLILPGAIAGAGYVWLAIAAVPPNIQQFLAEHDALTALAGIALAIGAGFIVDSIGTYVEHYLLDKRAPDAEDRTRIWWRYLMIMWEKDKVPIAQGYLRRVLTSLKVELNTFVSLFVGIWSILLLSGYRLLPCTVACWAFFGVSAAIVLTYIAAKDSASLLAEIRKCMVLGNYLPAVPERHD
jgi:hypothetical protein